MIIILTSTFYLQISENMKLVMDGLFIDGGVFENPVFARELLVT